MNIRTLLTVIVAASLLDPMMTWAQTDKDTTAKVANGVLRTAVDESQPRMVKVYGAAAGRVDGFATGVIVSDQGHVITSQGVFLDGQQIRVVTSDGKTHEASILKRDRIHQIALLKIQVETPEYFELAQESFVEKGDWVVALSNAFKVAERTEALSATLGIVSLNSTIEAKLTKRDVAYKGDCILVDCITSNPGAAGGAIVTLDGKLVGTIGKIINSSETNTRLNYAVPSHIISQFINDENQAVAETETKGPPGELGIRIFKLGGRNNPAYIDRVSRRGPAAKAGLETDDMIVSIGGEKIGSVSEYERVVEALVAGQEVLVVVKRGPELIRVPVTPEEK